jgi:HSP20 family protein
MSFFPRAFVDTDATSFTPLFRLLDDFDTYSRNTGGNGNQHHGRRGHMRTFQPRFDVKELPEAYELHGELPGIEQKDVEIEFTDPQTLTVRGRTERSYTSGTPPSHLVEGQKSSGAITEGGEQQQQQSSHKATVEDEKEANKDKTETSMTTTDQKSQQQQEPQAKYWVSERSVGEFARSFSFPGRVDQDAVKASMKNGILSIVVPKAKKHESRKIVIGS